MSSFVKRFTTFFERKTRKVSPERKKTLVKSAFKPNFTRRPLTSKNIIGAPTGVKRVGGISITKRKSNSKSALKSFRFPPPPARQSSKSKSQKRSSSKTSSHFVSTPSSSRSSLGSLSLSSGSSGSSTYSGSLFSNSGLSSRSSSRSLSRLKSKHRQLPLTPRDLSALKKRLPKLTRKSTNKSIPIRRKLPLSPQELTILQKLKPFSKRKLPETPKKGLRRTGAFKGYPNPYGI